MAIHDAEDATTTCRDTQHTGCMQSPTVAHTCFDVERAIPLQQKAVLLEEAEEIFLLRRQTIGGQPATSSSRMASTSHWGRCNLGSRAVPRSLAHMAAPA